MCIYVPYYRPICAYRCPITDLYVHIGALLQTYMCIYVPYYRHICAYRCPITDLYVHICALLQTYMCIYVAYRSPICTYILHIGTYRFFPRGYILQEMDLAWSNMLKNSITADIFDTSGKMLPVHQTSLGSVQKSCCEVNHKHSAVQPPSLFFV